MRVSVIDIVLIILFFQLISLTPFLLFHKGNRSVSNRILAAFLLSKALCISNFLSFRLYDFFYTYFPHLIYVGSSFTILWGPLLYFYTKSITIKAFKFKKWDILHFIPFASHFLYLTFKYHRFGADIKRQLLTSDLFHPEYHFWLSNYNHITFFIYTAISLYLVMNYRRQIKQAFSSIESIQLTWLLTVLIGFSIKWACDVCYSISIWSEYSIIPLTISRIVLFLFINLMIYQGLKYPILFTGIDIKRFQRKSSLSDTIREQYVDRLKRFMETRKPYLQPDITLVELADMVEIPPRSLSEVINISFRQNFYDFINGYRIKECEQLLTDPAPRFKTTLEILYEVGFNSKSSFHTAFKKTTGMTPTQFKKSHTN